MKTSTYFLFLIGIFSFFNSNGQWQKQSIASQASFRSIAVVNQKIVWAGGSNGTVLKTTNGGKYWRIFHPKNSENLDFRGIAALDSSTAWVMSAGEAETGAAKILKTSDGGLSWKVVFESSEKGVFLDCLKMTSSETGFVVGDPIGAKPYLLKTSDAGETWQRISPLILPNIRPNEASFAASNSNIAHIENAIWISTQSRIFHSEDHGNSWMIQKTPFQQGESSGIFGLYFWSKNQGIAVGGDYKNDKAFSENNAFTSDGGQTWYFAENALPQGLKEAAWKLPNDNLIAVGTSGTGVFDATSKTWTALDSESFHALQCYKNTCFAVGGKGNVGKQVFKK